MKAIIFLGALFASLVLSPTQAHARAVRIIEMKTLMKDSQLVFVGQVKSVKPSGITTELTYPTWENVIFEWLRVEVEVIEPVKGTKKGELVSTLLLSTRGPGPMINPPGMVEPKVGQCYLLCLLPTSSSEVYAAVTAPFDDREAIFLLDRKHWTDGAHYYKEGKEVAFQEQNEKNRALWDLVDDKGVIKQEGAEYLRKQYAEEIATPPAKDAVIHLKWKKQVSAGGWQSNVPDDGSEADGKKRGETPSGPITRP